jgi:Icc protein
MPLAWATDLHLDTLGWKVRGDRRQPKVKIKAFCDKLRYELPHTDGLLITGDIADGHPNDDWFGILTTAYPKPIYFVLGNHDYFGCTVDITNQRIRRYCRNFDNLHWLTSDGMVELAPTTVLIGHDGWYCGTEGDGVESKLCKKPGQVPLADMTPTGVSDLFTAALYGMPALFGVMADMANKSTTAIVNRIDALADDYERVLIATHVPPFWEANHFRGRRGPSYSAPFYVNKILGEALLKVCAKYPGTEFVVHAGHCHAPIIYEAAPNLTVKVGKARCGFVPGLQPRIEF